MLINEKKDAEEELDNLKQEFMEMLNNRPNNQYIDDSGLVIMEENEHIYTTNEKSELEYLKKEVEFLNEQNDKKEKEVDEDICKHLNTISSLNEEISIMKITITDNQS